MTKILHTSDWHLGHTLYNYDRTEEQASMLSQMINIVREQQPDLFLLCGDVYHTPQPSAAVQTMFANALVDMHLANPGMAIIITAGNHDSGSRHDIFKTPWKALNVYTFGNININQADDLIIEIPGKAFVIAMPYLHERNMPKGLFRQVLDHTEERNLNGLPIILMAHTTVRGCDFSGHDNASEYTVGGIDSYELSDMGNGYDYLALGHIHHGQFIYGSHQRARYSGTPLPVSFDETFKHSVTLVEINSHGDIPIFNEIEIHTDRPLVTLPTEGTASWEKAKELLSDFPDDIEAYLRLNVQVNDFLPAEANAEAMQVVKGKKCRFCLIQPHRTKGERNDDKMMSVQEFKAEKPIDIAMRYANDMGINFDCDMKELFQEVLDSISEDNRI